MSEQKYRKWSPIDGVPDRLFVEAIHDDYEGFRVLVRGEDRVSATLRLSFGPVVAYRNINESYRLRTWASLPGSRGLPGLVILVNSKWIDWLVQESSGVLDSAALVHYAIYTPEDCIDIVTEFAPIVEWLNK